MHVNDLRAALHSFEWWILGVFDWEVFWLQFSMRTFLRITYFFISNRHNFASRPHLWLQSLGPISILFIACSISDRQQSLQLFTAISVIITKPHVIDRWSVHRHTPCFKHSTIKHTKKKKKAAVTQRINSKHSDLVTSWGHLNKLFLSLL